jgi:hypothetical protein
VLWVQYSNNCVQRWKKYFPNPTNQITSYGRNSDNFIIIKKQRRQTVDDSILTVLLSV